MSDDECSCPNESNDEFNIEEDFNNFMKEIHQDKKSQNCSKRCSIDDDNLPNEPDVQPDDIYADFMKFIKESGIQPKNLEETSDDANECGCEANDAENENEEDVDNENYEDLDYDTFKRGAKNCAQSESLNNTGLNDGEFYKNLIEYYRNSDEEAEENIKGNQYGGIEEEDFAELSNNISQIIHKNKNLSNEMSICKRKSNLPVKLLNLSRNLLTNNLKYNDNVVAEIIEKNMKALDRAIPAANDEINTESSTSVKEISKQEKKAMKRKSSNTHNSCCLKEFEELSDYYINGLGCILRQNERYYYENSLSRVRYHLDLGYDQSKLLSRHLKRDFIASDFNEVTKRWINLRKLSKSSLNEYCATDKYTRMQFSIKYKSGEKVPEKYMRYLKEREYLLTGHSNVYVVQFYYSFVFNNIDGMFFLYEYCPGNLWQFAKVLKQMFTEFQFDWSLEYLNTPQNSEVGSIINYWRHISKSMHFNLEEVVVGYILELFSALDFLSSINVVNRALRPQNILLSQFYHVKITEFSPALYSQMIINPGPIISMNNNTNSQPQHPEFLPSYCYYLDLELNYFHFLHKFSDSYSNFNDEKDAVVPLTYLPTNQKSAQNNFLSDLWAIVITILDILIPTTNIWHIRNTNLSNLLKLKKATEPYFISYNIMQIFYFKSNINLFIKPLLTNIFGAENLDFVEFLLSCLAPRQLRAKNFTKNISIINKLHSRTSQRAIDSTKVENLTIFKRNNVSTTSAYLKPIPTTLKEILNSKQPIEFKSCNNWFQMLADNENQNYLDQ